MVYPGILVSEKYLTHFVKMEQIFPEYPQYLQTFYN